MISRSHISALLLPAIFVFCACQQAVAVSQVSFVSHRMRLAIDVPMHALSVVDSGLIEVNMGRNFFQLSHTALIERLLIGDKPVDFRAVPTGDVEQLQFELGDGLADVATTGQAQVVVFEFNQDGTFPFRMDYRAEFYQDISDVHFSNETVGAEVFGTITDEGAYLSPPAFYYPRGGESLARFRLTADIPDNWESISDGNSIGRSETGRGRKVQTWENPLRSDGCMFMAAPYVVRSTWVDSVQVACYFFEADTGLIDDYLGAAAGYIGMYTDLIGPYPFERFAVAENFFPTGYGMPAWTLLGQQVLRLPFIKQTSLGHEVLHNWWGNSVYVDFRRGNWCEAATVYGADYRYKLMESPAAARDYRKEILKQYDSYVNEGNDFPVRDFKSRTSPNSRTIGYNKGMMVYHMIEQEIGTEPFFKTWKEIYADYRGVPISWEEWIGGFERASGTDLSYIIPQWIDQPGAPVLDIAIVGVTKTAEDPFRSLQLKLMERSGRDYRLRVPLRFSGAGVVWDTSVFLASQDSVYTIPLPEGVSAVEVDPEYDLFRKLYPEEIEPIISATLGNGEKMFVADELTGMVPDFALFGENLSGGTVKVVAESSLDASKRDGAPILLNPPVLPADLQDKVSVNSDSVIVKGVSYPVAGHTFVLAGEGWNGYDEYLVILSWDGSSLPRIGQLVPHYGKYSFLAFDGTRNVGKGQWEVTGSRLKKSLP
jgi:aminopeptidase N